MPDSFDFSLQPKPLMARATAQPIITVLLIVLSVVITAAYLTSGDSPGTPWYVLGHFALPDRNAIWSANYWTLIASVFVHGDILHILFDMYWLWIIGRAIETSISVPAYLGFVLASAILGGTSEMILTGSCGIGMSGVVYAMFGLMWAGRGRFPEWRAIATKQNLNLFVIWGIYCIVATYSGWMKIANGAHAGGLVFGLSIGWLCYAPRRRPLWAIPLTLLCVLAVAALTWMPWFGPWTWWKGKHEHDNKHFASAISWYQRSLTQLSDNDHTNQSGLWNNIAICWDDLADAAEARNDRTAAERAMAESNTASAKSKELASQPSMETP